MRVKLDRAFFAWTAWLRSCDAARDWGRGAFRRTTLRDTAALPRCRAHWNRGRLPPRSSATVEGVRTGNAASLPVGRECLSATAEGVCTGLGQMLFTWTVRFKTWLRRCDTAHIGTRALRMNGVHLPLLCERPRHPFRTTPAFISCELRLPFRASTGSRFARYLTPRPSSSVTLSMPLHAGQLFC